MKILILANNDLGLYNFRKELIERLILEKNEIYISLPNGKRVKDLEELGCKYIETEVDRRGTNPVKDCKLLLKYFKILKQIKPNIVLTYTIKPNIYGGVACRIKKIPYICNITGLGTATENESIVQKLIIKLYKFALKKVKCCFIQNKENFKFIIDNKIAKEEKCKLIPGSGVNLERFRLLQYPSDDKIEFLFIGRVMKEKGIDQYLEMAEHIKKKYPNTVFHVLGFCEEEYEIKLKELEEKGIIKYHGLQDDIIPFIQNSHCTIHPTYYPEGMSNVLLESSASGRPIITTNRSGCREIIEDNKNGYIVREKDSKDLIDKVEKFIKLSNEEKKEMGLYGRKKMEKEFDRNIVIDAYINEIRPPKKEKIRVLQVFGKLNRGGAETMLMNLYRQIDKDEINFDFVKHTEEECAYDNEIYSLGGKIYSIPRYKVYNHFQYKRAWNKFFREHKEFDIIHCHVRSTASIILKIAKKYGLITIAHSHNTSSGKGISSVIKNILQRRIRYISKYYIGCSKQSAEWLFGKKIANSDKCIVLNNSIDTKKYMYDESVRNDVRKELGIKNKEILIGNVGRFAYAKNHKFLIDIFEQICNLNKNYKLVLVGDGELKAKIQNYVTEKGLDNKVIFTGVRKDVNRILQAVDLIIMPSIHEGLPVTLIEAQCNGLKCYISSNITDEVCLSEKNIIKISLDDNALVWAEKVIGTDNIKDKEGYKNVIRKGYDIENTTRIIERFYKNIYEKRKYENIILHR